MAGYIGSKASVVSSGAERKKVFDITTTTTSLTGLSYTPNQVHVFHNGVRLVDGTDYTATNGTSITLTTAAENGDQVVVISYATFQPADTYAKSEVYTKAEVYAKSEVYTKAEVYAKSEVYTKAEGDGRYVDVAGDTMTGALTSPKLSATGQLLYRGKYQSGIYEGYVTSGESFLHIKTNLITNADVGMWVIRVYGYSYGAATIIDSYFGLHLDSSNNIYSKAYNNQGNSGSVAQNIYRSADNRIVICCLMNNVYFWNYMIDVSQGPYAYKEVAVTAITQTSSNTGAF